MIRKTIVKPVIDIVIGTVVPLVIFMRLTDTLGIPLAHVFAALAPVAYVLIDTLLISRCFNAITTYVALTSIMQGVLAFWFVDGWRYALKDTAGSIVAVLLVVVSLMVGRPVTRYFVTQVFQPDTPSKSAALEKIFRTPEVRSMFVVTTSVIGVLHLAFAIVNFMVNLNIVTAPFGAEDFNDQAVRMNVALGLAFAIVSLVVINQMLSWIYESVYSVVPLKQGKDPRAVDFWELMRRGGWLEET
ncbi:VC0807 family protein [Roseiflexus sp.]|uniref:VC0807 family protein n=1 Tax=Roseiflexus sp. TaxID=2562120 RepID=UPI00398B6AA8